MSVYEDLMEADERDNEYGRLIDEEMDSQRQQVAGSLAVASRRSPGREAEVINIANRERIPAGLVSRNLEQFKKPTVDYDRMIRDTPRLAEWISNPENASIAHDDIDALSGIEKFLGRRVRPTQEEKGFFRASVLDQLVGGYYDLRARSSLFSAMQASEQARTGKPTFGDLQNKALAASLQTPEGQVEFKRRKSEAVPELVAEASRFYERGEAIPLSPELMEFLNENSDKTLWEAFRAAPAKIIVELGARSGLASLQGLAGGVALGAAGSAAGPAGSIAGFATGMGGSSARIEYMASVVDGLRQHGVNVRDPTALNAAVADESLMTEIHKVALIRSAAIGGLDAVAGIVGARNLTPGLSNVIVRELANVGVQMPAQAVLGATGEAVAQVASGEPVKPREIAAEAAGEFVTAPVDVAAAAMVGTRGKFAEQAARVEAAQSRQRIFDALASTESKLRDRVPEKFREFVASATKDGPVSTVYVPAEQFAAYFQAQNIDPAEVLGKMPEVAAQLEEALASGGDLAIPMADFATYIAPSKHYAGLSQDLRLDPDDMTAREAAAWQANADTLVKELQAAATEEKPLHPDRAVYEDVLDQLVGTGMEQGTAERNATLMASVFRSLGERTGEDPMALYERYGLRIQRGQAPEAAQQEVERIVADDNLLLPVIEELRTARRAPAGISAESAQPIETTGARRAPPETAAPRWTPVPEAAPGEPTQLLDGETVEDATAAVVERVEAGVPAFEAVIIDDGGGTETIGMFDSQEEAAAAAEAAAPPVPVEAAPAVPEGVIQGGTSRVRIGDRYVATQFVVMEAADLAPTIDKAENQYRDRNRAAAQAQVSGIAQAIDFNLLGDSPLMDYGAPTLALDGRVVGGNGRLAAIRLAYQSDGGAAYKRPLVAQAERFGLSRAAVEAMQAPVLVRVLAEDVDVRAAAIASNEGGALAMSALETAKVDAERLGSLTDFAVAEDGQLNVAQSRPAIRRWISRMPASQRGAIVDAQGQLSAEGMGRLRNAMLYRAYGDSPTLSRLIESVDPGSRNIAAALMRVAPRVAELRDAIASGDRYDLDLSEDLQAAVEKLNRIRESGQSVDEALAQQDIFGAGLSPEAETIVRFFGANLRSSRALAEFLDRYYDAVDRAGSPKQADILGGEAPDKTALLDQAVAAAKPARQIELESTGSLFQAAQKPWWQRVGRLFQAEAPKPWRQYLDEWTPDDRLSPEQKKVETEFMAWIMEDPERAIAQYAAYRNRKGENETLGGKLLNTDLVRELWPAYRKNRSLAVAVHEPASALTKAMYAKRLLEAPGTGEDLLVLFSAGGTGAGKTSGLRRFLSADMARAHIIYDTNMNGFASGNQKIQQAFAANHEVEIVYTWRDPLDALRNGALARAARMERDDKSGRTLPVDEHLETHFGSNQAIFEFVAAYSDDDRVGFGYVFNDVDYGKSRRIELAEVPKLNDLEYNSVREQAIEIIEEEQRAGLISDAIAVAFLQSEVPARRRQPDERLGRESQAQRRGRAEGRDTPAGIIGAAIARAGLDIQTATPEQVRAAVRDTPNILLQAAFHGSPYDFDRFSLAKIGTGEGVQAYGYGLYFAESPGVAEQYKKYVVDMKMVDRLNGRMAYLADKMQADESGGYRNFRHPETEELAKEYDELLAERDRLVHGAGGKIYQVEIPDEAVAKMLDWDARFSDQPQSVQDALPDIAEGERRYKAKYPGGGFGESFGSNIYGVIEEAQGGSEAASKYLASIGIPGIKYLDAGSRAATKFVVHSFNADDNELNVASFATQVEADQHRQQQESKGYRVTIDEPKTDGTRNLVVFDDSIVEITHKNGEPLTKKERAEFLQGMEQTPRAATTFGADRQFTISLFETADLTSFQHESAHFYLEVLRDIASRPDAPQQIRDDMETFLKWAGVEGGLEKWNAMSIEEHRPFHEQFARGFEAYLFEGKAPNADLQALFARFRAWLVSIYRSVKALNVSLNPEIRAVFDRLVATDDEIRAANAAQNYVELFTTAESAGYSPAEFKAYRGAVEKARIEAEERLTREILTDLTREQKAWWAEDRARIQKEVEAEVYANPVYRALAFLQRGTNPDGTAIEGVTPVKLNRAALVAQYGEDFLKTLPRPYLYAAEGGVAPDVVGAMFGFDSGDAMLQAILGAVPMRAAVTAATAERMRAKHGDMLLDGSLVEKAMEAVHNDRQAELMAAEMKALRRLERQVRPALRAREMADVRARREAREALTPDVDERKLISAAAERAIAGKRIRDINPNQYRVAEAKAARLAFEAAGKRDYQVAYMEKRKQLLNHELFRAAVKAKEQAEKDRNYFKKFSRPKVREHIGKAGEGILEQIDSVLADIGFERISGKAIDRKNEVLRQIDAGEIMVDPTIIRRFREQGVKNWRELTIDEFSGLRDVVMQLEHRARDLAEIIVNGEKMEIAAVATEIALSVLKTNKPIEITVGTRKPMENARRNAKQALLAWLRPSEIARQLDGGEDFGAATRNLIVPIRRAYSEKLIPMQRKAQEDMAKLYRDTYSNEELTKFSERIFLKDLGLSMTRGDLLSLAMNWGNEGNRQALLDSKFEGRPLFTKAGIIGAISKLRSKDLEFVQSVWNYLDTYWPELSALEKRRRGVSPKKVEASPFTVGAADGVNVNLRGGYFPLKFDPELSAIQHGDDLEQDFKKFVQGRATSATTRAGATHERVGSGGRPVRLGIGVIDQHLHEIIRDIALGDAVRFVKRVLDRPEIREALVRTGNADALTTLRLWLQDSAVGEIAPAGFLNKSSAWTRIGFTKAKLAWNVVTTGLQVTGLVQSKVVLGDAAMAHGVAQYLKNPVAMHKHIMAESAFLRSRYQTNSWNKDVADTATYLDAYFGGVPTRLARAVKALSYTYYWPIARMQMVVDDITWLAGYWKGVEQRGLADDAAVTYADSVVENAQTSGFFSDRSGIERGTTDAITQRQSQFLKLWTTLISYMLAKGNIAYARGRAFARKPTPWGAASLAGDLIMLFTVEAVLSAIIRGRLPDDDDDEPWAWWLMKETAASATSGIPVFREIAGSRYGGGTTPLGDTAHDLYKALAQTEQGEVDLAFIRAWNNVGGTLFHYPSTQINRAVDATWREQVEGEDVPLYEYLTGERKDAQ